MISDTFISFAPRVKQMPDCRIHCNIENLHGRRLSPVFVFMQPQLKYGENSGEKYSVARIF